MKNRDSLPSLKEALARSKLFSTSAGSQEGLRHQSSIFKRSQIESSGETPGGPAVHHRMSLPAVK